MWCYDTFFVTKYVILTSQWRISWRKRVIEAHKLKKVSRKNYNFDFMQLFPCSCDNTFIVLAFKIPLILTIYGHVGGNLISFISCNFTPFYPIEMGLSLYIFFLCSKNVCNVLALLCANCKFLMLLLKIGVTYDVILSRNVKNTFTMVKI